MSNIPLTMVVLVGLVGSLALLLGWASRRWPANTNALVDAIDELLPQTQCAQCGFPGCRPYAEAIAAGKAPIDLCPPGGQPTYLALAQVIGQPAHSPPQGTPPMVARIDESRCIGCFLCIPACPVDAIVGAPKYMHTVIAQECTGCELCIAPCPVDCIELLPINVDDE